MGQLQLMGAGCLGLVLGGILGPERMSWPVRGVCHECRQHQAVTPTLDSEPCCPQPSGDTDAALPGFLEGEVWGCTGSSLPQAPPTATLATPSAQPSLLSQIIQDRISGASAHPSLLWNSPPGALLALSTFSTSPSDFPFYHLQQGECSMGGTT